MKTDRLKELQRVRSTLLSMKNHFRDVVGEPPTHLTMTRVFYRYLFNLVAEVTGGAQPLVEYVGCVITERGGSVPDFEFIRGVSVDEKVST